MKFTKNQALILLGLTVLWLILCSVSYVGGLATHQIGHVF